MNRLHALCAVVGGLAVSAVAFSSQATKKNALPSDVTYPQLYAGSDGETHFRDVTVPLTSETTAPPAEPIAQSSPQTATTIRHAAFPPRWGAFDRDHGVFHNASSARFITIRRGEVWIKASDGERRRFQPGDIVEVLDVAPSRGHITWVGDEPSIALFSNHR
jgi:hypothetical protein